MDLLHRNINDLLRQEDIEGYIELGAPNDEYDSEGESIYSAIQALPEDRRSAEEIYKIVSFIWRDSFNMSDEDLSLRHSALSKVSGKIAQQFLSPLTSKS